MGVDIGVLGLVDFLGVDGFRTGFVAAGNVVRLNILLPRLAIVSADGLVAVADGTGGGIKVDRESSALRSGGKTLGILPKYGAVEGILSISVNRGNSMVDLVPFFEGVDDGVADLGDSPGIPDFAALAVADFAFDTLVIGVLVILGGGGIGARDCNFILIDVSISTVGGSNLSHSNVVNSAPFNG